MKSRKPTGSIASKRCGTWGQRVAGPGMRGKDQWEVERVECGRDPCEPVGLDVRLAVDGREHVAAGLHAEPVEDPGALTCDRREDPVRVRHHVADDLASPRDALRLELRGGALVRAEQERRHSVDGDPVPLLGHLGVEAPQPGLDVGDGRAARSRAPASVEFVSPKTSSQSAVPPRPPGGCGAPCARIGLAQVEPVARLGEGQLLVEDFRQLGVVVLPRVEHDLLDPASRSAAESGADLTNWGRLPTTVSTRIGGYTTRPCGPLAQLVEQGTLNPKVEGSNPSRPIPETSCSRARLASGLWAASVAGWARGNVWGNGRPYGVALRQRDVGDPEDGSLRAGGFHARLKGSNTIRLVSANRDPCNVAVTGDETFAPLAPVRE